ncbi:MAG: DsbA family protein [Gammaproteobacteria bacterium]
MSEKPILLATVFTDYICPFCYIGDVRLERLRAEYDLKISWCFVEIHPDTPPEGRPVSELGYSDERWRQMMGNLERLADEDGIPLRAHDFTTNSHKSLLLAEAAKEAGADIFYRLHRRLFEAFFTDGLNIGDETVLAGLAATAGVPRDIISRAWGEPCYEERLQQYLAAAAELNVRATPTIFFGQQQRLDGALPYSAFLEAARAGAAEQHAPPA